MVDEYVAAGLDQIANNYNVMNCMLVSTHVMVNKAYNKTNYCLLYYPAYL